MRGKGLYFYMLKDDLIKSIKIAEQKLGGFQYVSHEIYKEPKPKIYNSIEELPDIGIIRPIVYSYYIALKKEKFNITKKQLKEGDYSYLVSDENGTLQFSPSGIYEGTKCVIMGKITTVSKSETRQLIFKEIKKAMLKNMVLAGGGVYVGKSIIENKEKYRIPYGSPSSPPEYDLDISNLVWVEKGKKDK